MDSDGGKGVGAAELSNDEADRPCVLRITRTMAECVRGKNLAPRRPGIKLGLDFEKSARPKSAPDPVDIPVYGEEGDLCGQ